MDDDWGYLHFRKAPTREFHSSNWLGVMISHRLGKIGKPMNQLAWDGLPWLCVTMSPARCAEPRHRLGIRSSDPAWKPDMVPQTNPRDLNGKGFLRSCMAAWLFGFGLQCLICLVGLVNVCGGSSFCQASRLHPQDCYISEGGLLWFSTNISLLSSVQNQCWLIDDWLRVIGGVTKILGLLIVHELRIPIQMQWQTVLSTAQRVPASKCQPRSDQPLV